MDNFQLAVENVLELEGGFVDNRHDPGGATNYGISFRYLKGLSPQEADLNKDGEVNLKDIKSMTKLQAEAFYRKNWWQKYEYNKINNVAIAIKILDMSVNMGGKQAHKLVQRACRACRQNLIDDGVLGEKSFEALNKMRQGFYLPALRCTQAGFYYALVMRNAALRKAGVKKKNGKPYEDFSVFLEGWLNRAYK